MPIRIELDSAIFRWQAKHNERMTMARLSELTGISQPTLYRIKSGEATNINLEKLNLICKVLECDLSDIMWKQETNTLSPDVVDQYENQRQQNN